MCFLFCFFFVSIVCCAVSPLFSPTALQVPLLSYSLSCCHYFGAQDTLLSLLWCLTSAHTQTHPVLFLYFCVSSSKREYCNSCFSEMRRNWWNLSFHCMCNMHYFFFFFLNALRTSPSQVDFSLSHHIHRPLSTPFLF